MWCYTTLGKCAKYRPTRTITKQLRMFQWSVVQRCGPTLLTIKSTYSCLMHHCGWATLTHSLINPNQLCAFGTDVQDNPFSNERLSIQPAFHDISIPLQTLGTIIYANTRAPTDQELGQHPHIVLSSDAGWDPHHIWFPSHAVEEESRSTINTIQHCNRDLP